MKDDLTIIDYFATCWSKFIIWICNAIRSNLLWRAL